MLFCGHWGESVWQPDTPLFWPDQKNNYDFCAFYPYAEGAQRANVPMPDLSEQDGTLENIGKWDFLVANKHATIRPILVRFLLLMNLRLNILAVWYWSLS